MVRPFPRYHELLVKRGLDVHGQDLASSGQAIFIAGFARPASVAQPRLVRLWQLSNSYPRLAELRKKNRGFTEEDKQEVLALQRTAMQEIVPMYKALAGPRPNRTDHHAVLSSDSAAGHRFRLCATRQAGSAASGSLSCAGRCRSTDPARRRLPHQTFGRPPVGLWPSEGSVCPEMLPMLQKAGLRWLATDEGILYRSLHMGNHAWNRHHDLYQPYTVGPTDHPLTMVFRDRDISDAFGFVYHKTTPGIGRRRCPSAGAWPRHDIRRSKSSSPIILDGENPWEHYHDGGERFLSLLFRAFEQDRAPHRPRYPRRTWTPFSRALATVHRPNIWTTCIPVPGSIRTSRSGSDTRKTIADGTSCSTRERDSSN